MSCEIASPRWDASSNSIAFELPDGSRAKFKLSAEIDGRRISPKSWTPTQEGGAKSEVEGLELQVSFKPLAGGCAGARCVVAEIRNLRGVDARLGRFSFFADGEFFKAPGDRLRVYKEGWTMASAAGSVRNGEKDFELNPDYKPFAVSSPSEYDDKAPGRISAEYAAVLNDKLDGRSVLAGFVSSGDQVTRLETRCGDGGLESIEAISYGDETVLSPGEARRSEELTLLSGDDGYGLLERFAELWAARMKALSWSHTPTGWCSWYYYFDKVTEADMLENAKWLAERKAEFPLEYVQMDDGYQRALGDWLVCDKAKFPRGLEFLAKEIKAAGFKPGIWLAPFLVEERSELYAKHPEWMVKDKAGATLWAMDWRGSRTAILDCTSPDALAWLTETFKTLALWGYEYVKLDFLVHECGAISKGGVYSDPKATRVQALRRGLEAIRKGIGEGKFILGCTNVLGAGAGIVNACRTGTDITPYWMKEGETFKEAPTVPNVCRNIINRRYMHRRLWISDPDTHIARLDNNKLTEDETILWTSALFIAGGMLLLSDRFSTLGEKRAALSKTLLENLDAFKDARPLDVFEEEYPSVWIGRERGRVAIGLFNFSEKPKSFDVDLAKAGLPAPLKAEGQEFWSGKPVKPSRGALQETLKPHSCKLFIFKLE